MPHETPPPGVHYIPRATANLSVTSSWEDRPWERVQPLRLQNYMGNRPEHFPQVEAKLAYDEEALGVIFLVDDRYVRAVARQHQEMVCLDSCVELFFTPGEDISRGYMNLEMNCGGTMLLHYQKVPRGESVAVAANDLSAIEVGHQLPRIVDPEIETPTRWSVSYRLPLSLVNRYFPDEIAWPAKGVRWRGNVFKCGDETSHPHWLTWSPVDHPSPDFHRPDQFGSFEFG